MKIKAEKRTSCIFCSETWENSQECLNIPSNVRRFSSESFPMWRCQGCHSIHSLNVVDLTNYYAYYPRRDSATFTTCTRFAYANLLRKLKVAGLKPDHRILDYGCGHGGFIAYLKERGYSSVKGYDPFFTDYSLRYTLQEGIYDAVVAVDVFEHIEDGKASLIEWKGLLRPGGLLCLTMPNADGLKLESTGQNFHALHQPYHLHIPSVKAIETMAKEVGLKKIRIYEQGFWETPIPTINKRFIFKYLSTGDNTLDVAYEPPNIVNIMKSPLLFFYSFFGFFLTNRCEMVTIFRA